MSNNELIRADACTVVEWLRRGEVSSHELLEAVEARIAAVDSHVNALPILCFERARAQADALMRRPSGERGLLAGLPVAIKDLADLAGVRTTYGSPIYANHVPARSDILVETLEARGALPYAKSNTSEFGAGANTFNEVFGATRNPWNLARSAAGSSGGAAAALATGMAWMAHGSDFGGSLRNPASFCGIVGMRPSIGRVARTPSGKIDRNLSASGPMARTVEDLALMLDAMAGEHPGDPLSLPVPPSSFLTAARSGERPRRVAWSATLGLTPVDPEVAAITRNAAERFAEAGATVEEAHPDFAGMHECFHVLRAYDYYVTKAELMCRHRDLLKPEIIWNIEKGAQLTLEELERAENQRVTLSRRALEFFATYDLLLTPATIVPPFPVEQRYPTECDGVTFGDSFENYLDWLAIAYAITMVCCPALSLPCGFTSDRLPVGLQIAGPPRSEARILAAAKVMEDILGVRGSTPIDPK